MKDFYRKWKIEIIWIIGNLTFIIKYSIDRYFIQCEPCLDINNCPPCQTDFMRDFWIYTAIFNILIIIGLIVKKIVNGSQSII